MPLLAKVRGFFWPLGNLAAMAAMPATPAKEAVPAATRFAGKPVSITLEDHLGVQLATLPKLALAALIWARFVDLQGAAAGFDAPATFSWSPSGWPLLGGWAGWLGGIIARDMAITWAVAGGWDTVLYSRFSPFAARMAGNKFNPAAPSWAQLRRDMFWSSVSTVLSSLLEAALLWAWARGALPAFPGASPSDSWWSHWPTLAWCLAMPYTRIAHFYAIHRAMHKWFPFRKPGTGVIPDVGAWLYRHVHSLHHKSKNPTAWSGVSMHPVESAAYYSAMLLPIQLGWALLASGLLTSIGAGPGINAVHPVVFLYHKFDLTIGALVGHDGYGWPGGGSQAHWLHHNNMDCNYSESYAPFDWLFDTWAADEEDFERMMQRRRRAANGGDSDGSEAEATGEAAAAEATKGKGKAKPKSA